MRPTKSLLRYTVAVTLASFGTLYAGDFKKLGYETPAYVDLEFTEMRVNEPAGTLAINIIRTGDFRQTTTVDYQTVADSASEGQDYKGAGGTLVFKPGEGFKTITLEVLSDEAAEDSENFRFELTTTDPNAMLMRRSLQVTIEDAPMPVGPPQLQVASAGGNILLSWEGSDTCALERTTNPAGGAWEQVACAPVTDGNRCEVAQPLGGPLFFYRLRLP